MAETRKEYDFKIPVGLLRNLITEFQVFTRVHPTDLVFSQLTVRKQSIGYESRFNSEEFQEFLDEYSDADNSYIHLEYKVDQKNNKIVFSLNYQGPPEELPQKTKLTINLPNKGRVDKLFKEIDDFYNQKTRETILNSDDVAPNESTLPVDAEDVQTPQVSEELDASSESESEISNSINDTNGSPKIGRAHV